MENLVARRGFAKTVLAAGAAAVALGVSAVPAGAATPLSQYNVVDTTSANVTGQALPTAQIDDGVVWKTLISGGTIFAGGDFHQMRPAGAKKGVGLVARSNVAAVDERTGVLKSWSADTNGVVRTMAVSPDGRFLYLGGDFTSVQGVAAAHVARVNIATDTVDVSWKASTNAAVQGIAVTSSGVFVGGDFSAADGAARSRLAEFSPADGSLVKGWVASANSRVKSVASDGSHVFIGGQFTVVDGAAVNGMTSLDASSGRVLRWAANTVFTKAGSGGGVWDVRFDAVSNSVFVSMWSYSTKGAEGVARLSAADGSIVWFEDCHGDSYGSAPLGGVLYTVSHEHDCTDQGGWSQQTRPGTSNTWYHRATAFSVVPNGSVTLPYNGSAYSSFGGVASTAQFDWFPELAAGSYTGASQAAWSVDADASAGVVVLGGEFPTVNGRVQQGLVRFATSAAGGRWSVPSAVAAPVVSSPSAVSHGVVFQSQWVNDGEALGYEVWRTDADGRNRVVVSDQVVSSTFFDAPQVSVVDSRVTAGRHYVYGVDVQRPGGVWVRGAGTSV